MTSDTRSTHPVTTATATLSRRHTRCDGPKRVLTSGNGSCDSCDGLQSTPSHPSITALVEWSGHPATVPVTHGRGAQEPGSLADHVTLALATEASVRAAGDGLPLAPLSVPIPPPSLYYTVTPIDARGRLADRSPIRALGWAPGQPIMITVLQRAMVVTAHAGGADSITRQGHLRLPARVRHACHLDTGSRLLIAAAPTPGVVVIYTLALLESILLAHHAPTSGGEAPS